MSELLAVEHVSKGFSRGGRWGGVLSDVSFTVGPGEIAAILGKRLAGKTTLLQIAAGMLCPDEGVVTLGDVEVTGISDRERSRLLGREIVWLDRRGPGLDVEVAWFVGLALALHERGRRESRRIAAELLDCVGAKECAGQTWGEISHGQQALVALARAFAGTPRLVVIDDLLDALPGTATEEAFALLRSLLADRAPGCRVLVSASEIDAAMFADSIWSLTRRGALTLRAGMSTHDGDVIPFPGRQDSRVSRGAGSS